MEQYNYISDWKDLIAGLSNNSKSIAYGILNSEGKLVDANDTLCHYLGTNTNDLSPENHFINPDIKKILNLNGDTDLVFEGVLTIGNFLDKNFVLLSKIYKRNNCFLIYAEADVLHLFKENGKMSQLNQDVNNLQRELIKEKRSLQQTLDQLKETQEMLIQSEKMNALGQMIAGVAHEINNPIAFVTNNLYELKKNADEFIGAYEELEEQVKMTASPEIKSSVQSIRKKNDIDFLTEDIGEIISESKMGVERVKKIVEDLRKFSRLDESEIKNIELGENIQSILTIIQSEISKKNIRFNNSTNEKVFLDCYPGQLNQAILNIIVNAIQAVDNGGEISLEIEEASENIYINVTDNGIGMNEEDMKKIFDPFFTTKPIGTGTGLGLSITYKIIHDLHKGKIEVESTINKGSIIKFIIPKKINK